MLLSNGITAGLVDSAFCLSPYDLISTDKKNIILGAGLDGGNFCACQGNLATGCNFRKSGEKEISVTGG